MRGLGFLGGLALSVLFVGARNCTMRLRIADYTNMTVSATRLITFVSLEGVTLPFFSRLLALVGILLELGIFVRHSLRSFM